MEAHKTGHTRPLRRYKQYNQRDHIGHVVGKSLGLPHSLRERHAFLCMRIQRCKPRLGAAIGLILQQHVQSVGDRQTGLHQLIQFLTENRQFCRRNLALFAQNTTSLISKIFVYHPKRAQAGTVPTVPAQCILF